MRIGLIGSGKHGSRYAQHIVDDVKGMTLAAISRRSGEGEAQAGRWNCRWYKDWQELVADPEVDAVIGTVPPALNPLIARACADHGKSLLLEKPLAVTSAAAAEIVSLFQQKDLKLTVGQTLRYNPVIRKLRSELASIGTLYNFSANQRLEPSTLPWHSDPDIAGAGVSFHTAVHVFDALRFITGREIQRVMAVYRQWHNAKLEDLLAVMIEMEQGVIGTIDCSKVGHARSGRYEFVGLDGQIHGEQIFNKVEIIRGMEVTKIDPGPQVNTILPLLEDWFEYLCERGPNPVPGSDGQAAVRLCECCLASSRSGKWVVV